MARIGHRRLPVGIDAGDQTGGEASVDPSQQPAVQTAKDGCRALGEFRERTEGAHDQRHRHGRFQSLAAHVPQGNRGRSALQGDDLEEIAAHLPAGR